MLSIWQTSFGSRLDFIGKCDILYIVFFFPFHGVRKVFFVFWIFTFFFFSSQFAFS